MRQDRITVPEIRELDTVVTGLEINCMKETFLKKFTTAQLCQGIPFRF